MDIKSKLPDIVEVARLAPSVHNTQPWLVSAGDDTITVTIDTSHTLVDGDPTGRQTIISLGIFCEALTIAAKQQGFTVTGATHDEAGAVLKLKPSPDSQDTHLVHLLEKRTTDRSIFKPAPVDAAAVKRITNTVHAPGIAVHVVTDPKIIKTVAELTGKGISLALSSPAFRKELSHCLTLPWSANKRGIAVESLYLPWPLAVAEPSLLQMGVRLGAEKILEQRRWESASGLMIITADGDLADYWLEAGRTYLQACLAITDLGYAQATSAAIVEASNYHDDIEELLGTKQRILALVRFGQGNAHPRHSPRVPAAELITSN